MSSWGNLRFRDPLSAGFKLRPHRLVANLKSPPTDERGSAQTPCRTTTFLLERGGFTISVLVGGRLLVRNSELGG